MKPVSVLEVIASSRGGGAVHVRDVAAGIDGARFRVEVVMPEDGGQTVRADFEDDGIALHALAIAGGFRMPTLRQLRRLMARFDIVHAHGARAAFWVRLAALAMSSRRPRIVFTIHGFTTPFDRRWRRMAVLALERVLSCRTDRYVAVCEAERQAVIAAGFCSPDRIEVIRNGIDCARFVSAVDGIAVKESLGVPADAVLITTICRLDRPRDFVTLLLAFREVCAAERNAHLLIVGGGPEHASIERLAGDHGVESRVTLAGQRNDVGDVLAAADVFVLTSTGGDGLPLSILEAMAAGIPVIASACDGIPEAVVAGETGLLVPKGDATSLAAAITRLLRKPELRGRMGLAARARAVSEFDLGSMLTPLARLYDKVAGRTEGRAAAPEAAAASADGRRTAERQPR
jgi:glycosyltransferase involved in cell wall biosynthesis